MPARGPAHEGPSVEELLRASDTELHSYLESRETLIAKALVEVEELELAPRYFAERLRRLEDYFADLRPGDTVRLVDPLLVAETEALQEVLVTQEQRDFLDRSHLDHEEDHASGSWFAATGRVQAHVEHEELVLGSGFMALDHNALHYKRAAGARQMNYHPVLEHHWEFIILGQSPQSIEKVHYAGNLERPIETVQPMFVAPGGVLERRSIVTADPRTTFWLERPPQRGPPLPPPQAQPGDRPLFGQAAGYPAPSQPDLWSSPQPQRHSHEHPMHQEGLAVDWLGLARRGVPADGLGEAA
mmetsp:Transcript_107486/g.342652  ORF Transcript_107486/g.342652 Transcript_107486/m.342652 type:complete len:300 (+) Transcript_107486:198-1097(+)